MIKAVRKFLTAAFAKRGGAGNVLHASEKCPECGTSLMGRGESWRCPNLDCPAQIRANLERWCSPEAMDIAGGDAALVAKLVGHGLVRDLAELYRLKVKELAALPGMNQASALLFFDALKASLKRDAWRLLVGLGIPRIGAPEAKSLCRHFGSVDNVFAAGAPRLTQAEGVGAEAARSLAQWHSDPWNRRLLKRLFKAGLNFKA
jgi:DNA ligase (NAD+)